MDNLRDTRVDALKFWIVVQITLAAIREFAPRLD